MTQITFIIPSYNTQTLTLSCIKSIYKHEKPHSFEIIVVDNNSTDESVTLIKQKYSQVKIIISHQNLGFSKANNLAIAQSQGEFIILLNSDTELIMPISKLLMSHFTNSKIGASVPQLLNPDLTIQPSVFQLPTLSGAIQEYWLGRPFTFSKYAPNANNSQLVQTAVMACMCIPKSVIEKIGDLNEDYFMYYEDLEFCRRLNQNNYQIIYDPNIQIIHHHGSSTTSSPNAWKKLIPSSKQYHGIIKHYLIYFVLRVSQIFHKV